MSQSENRRTKPPFRQALSRGLRFRCPRCGLGPVFFSFARIRESCPNCKLTYVPESGYYVGAMYLDYILSAAIFLALFVPSFFLPDFTHLSYETKNILWITFAGVLCLGLARPSYSLWLSIDYWISPWNKEAPEKGGGVEDGEKSGGKEPETLEVPLVSLTIRIGTDEPRRGTSGDTRENSKN